MALADNLVSYWKLDESSGNAADSVGSNTLTNNNSTAYATGKINNGIDFESSSSNYLSITDAAQSGLDLGANFTISLWYKPESYAANHYIIGKYVATGNQRSYLLSREAGNTLFYISATGTSTITSLVCTPTFTNGVWYYIVVTFNAGTLTMYVDGTSVGSSSGHSTPYNGTAEFTIGRANGGDYTDGIIDEVGIWSRTLTSDEVTELYNSGNGYQYPFVQNLIMTATTAAFTFTGIDAILLKLKILLTEVGSFILTGYDTIFRQIGTHWNNQSKNTSTWSSQPKNTSIWSNQTKY